MTRILRCIGVLALVAVALTSSASPNARSSAIAAGKNAANAQSVDWPVFGNTTDNTRYSTLTQINTKNVKKLGLAWSVGEGPNVSGWESDPIVVNGVMYLTTNTDVVMALNAATGKLLWKYTPKVNFYLAVAGGGGGVPTNRGVSVANGKVYLLTFDTQLIALQASTGERLWHTWVTNPKDGYSETIPPTYWHGMLFVGSAESDAGLRGFVAAYDAQTGKQIWRWWAVPAAGQGWMPATGHHGGGDVWMPPTIDTQTGMLYVGTGNPSPDFVNTQRAGCNQWVDATVALDAKTGTFVWGHTQVCPDVWDYDSAQPPVIFNIHKNGTTIRAVGQGNKGGYYWIFNAKTGQVIAISPPVVREVRPKPNAKGALVCPSTAGIEFSPAAYSPLTQAVYVPALDTCSIMTAAPLSEINAHRQGAVDSGGTLLADPKVGVWGTMSAINTATGKFLWHVKVPGAMDGGALATAGNLVFSGANDGHFYAFDARTGKIVWAPYVAYGFKAAPMTYQVNGTQYVAIAVGGNGVAKANKALSAATFLVFKLGGGAIPQVVGVNTGSVPTEYQMPDLSGMTKKGPWMYVDTKNRHAVITMLSAATSDNSGFNFDGYSKGAANFIVPQGWNVDFLFSNKSTIPHSLAIAANSSVPAKLVPFGFGVKQTFNAFAGTGPGVRLILSLYANRAGKYTLVCLVPGHIQTGMWDYFTISSTATVPSIQVKK